MLKSEEEHLEWKRKRSEGWGERGWKGVGGGVEEAKRRGRESLNEIPMKAS